MATDVSLSVVGYFYNSDYRFRDLLIMKHLQIQGRQVLNQI